MDRVDRMDRGAIGFGRMTPFATAAKVILGCKLTKSTLSDHSIDGGTGHRHPLARRAFSDDLRRPGFFQPGKDELIERTVGFDHSLTNAALAALDVKDGSPPGVIPILFLGEIALYFPGHRGTITPQLPRNLAVIFSFTQKLR